jgi:hypothetical protein
MHGTENVGDCTRITFVFDVPHSKWNPWLPYLLVLIVYNERIYGRKYEFTW